MTLRVDGLMVGEDKDSCFFVPVYVLGFISFYLHGERGGKAASLSSSMKLWRFWKEKEKGRENGSGK